jgi:methyl-accepting chemotaxis protein
VALLAEAGASVVVADTNEQRAADVAAAHGATVVGAEKILEEECDVLAPCALGGVLDDVSVDSLRCRAVCGAATNQLAHDGVDDRLHARGVLYAPDRTKRGRSAQTPADSETLDLAELLTVLSAVRKGDFSVRMRVTRTGLAGKVADTLNEVVQLNEDMAHELGRVSLAVGKEGRITQRAQLARAGGSWAASLNSVNGLIGDLVQPTSEVSRVIGAVAKGDLSQTMALDIEGRPLMGEFLRIGRTVNSMVDQLSSFASEVTRVAREVGTEGKLGGQARVKGVAGTWKDLTDNVNSMAGNLTAQVRNIAEETTDVARGELNK